MPQHALSWSALDMLRYCASIADTAFELSAGFHDAGMLPRCERCLLPVSAAFLLWGASSSGERVFLALWLWLQVFFPISRSEVSGARLS